MTENEFEKLVEEIRPELVRIATRRCGRDQAEDAVQKALVYAWADVQRPRNAAVTPAKLSAWLRNGAVRQSTKELRGLGRLRAAQRNIRVLGNTGGKQTKAAGGADAQGMTQPETPLEAKQRNEWKKGRDN